MENSIGILGGGSWATAITKILSDNGHHVNWWLRDEANIRYILEHGHNGKYLRSAILNTSKLAISHELNSVVANSEILILAVPSAFISEVLSQTHASMIQQRKIVSAIKGMDPKSHLIISDFLQEKYQVPAHHIAVLSGPCHAEEVAQELTAYLTIGAEDQKLGEHIASLVSCENIYSSWLKDVRGIEFAGVLKNIYALANGIASGLKEGDNFKAVLMSNAVSEMEHFLAEGVPGERDITHSVYLGDLLVTAFSQHSRNRTFGNMIGHGYSVKSASLELNMVAEGYYASKSIWEFCKEREITLPIADAVYRILYENMSPKLEFKTLKKRLA